MCWYLDVGSVGDDYVMRAEFSWMRLVPFWKGFQRAPSPLRPCGDTVRRLLSMNEEVGSHQTPNLPAPWSWTFQPPALREKFLLFISQPVYIDVIPPIRRLYVSVKISKRGNLIGPAPHCGFHSHPPHSKWSLQASYYHLWPRKFGAFQAWECLTLGIRQLSQKVFLRPTLRDKYMSPILPDGFEEGFTKEVKYELGFKGGSPCS